MSLGDIETDDESEIAISRLSIGIHISALFEDFMPENRWFPLRFGTMTLDQKATSLLEMLIKQLNTNAQRKCNLT